MPFTVKISPSVVAGTQASIVPDVSPTNAGLMTPALLALLLGGGGGGGSVLTIVTETTRPILFPAPSNGQLVFNSDDLDVNVFYNGDWYLNGIPT